MGLSIGALGSAFNFLLSLMGNHQIGTVDISVEDPPIEAVIDQVSRGSVAMNLRGGWELIKKSYLGWMASRGFFWTLTFGWMVPSLLYLFVWVAVAGQGQVQGLTRDDFIVYYLCFIMLNQFTYPVCNWTVGDSIRMGRLSDWLLRPLPVMFEAIASDIAMKMVCTPFAVAVIVVLAFFLRPAVHFSLQSILFFLLALLLAQVLRFLMAYTPKIAMTMISSNW